MKSHLTITVFIVILSHQNKLNCPILMNVTFIVVDTRSVSSRLRSHCVVRDLLMQKFNLKREQEKRGERYGTTRLFQKDDAEQEISLYMEISYICAERIRRKIF